MKYSVIVLEIGIQGAGFSQAGKTAIFQISPINNEITREFMFRYRT